MGSTDWSEQIPEGEAAHLEALGAVLHGLQRKRAAGKPADRALHAKANLGLAAELRVSGDVPEPLRVGIFAKPGVYRAYVRYSNGAARRGHDGKADVRGLAVKLLEVPGKKVIEALAGATTHDLLFIRAPSMPTRTAAEFMALVRAAEKPALLPIRLALSVGPIRAFRILGTALRGLKAPMLPLASTTYFTALPIMWGKHAVKLSLRPHDAAPSTPPPASRSPNGLGEELASRLREAPVVYDLCAQLFVDETTTPIENPTVEWTAAIAPPQKVAELVITPQDPSSDRGKKLEAFVEKLSFDPWHAPVEFRPLGEMMRARNVAYRLSTKEREAANEPDGSERFD